MSIEIKKCAVLGAGVMGAQIAGHLSNAGIPSLLFDINDELARKGVDGLKSLKPAPLFDKKNTSLISPCTYDNDLEKLNECDLIIEAVAEKIEIKHDVYKKLLPHLKKDAILTSNTSGIPLANLVEVLPDDIQKRFLITHFFNPPRYLKLLELVKGKKTSDDVYDTVANFGETILGKGIVHAKDTPGFIGNRLINAGGRLVLEKALEMGLSVEDVDALSGTLVGNAKSAYFRTQDIVGLDTALNVSNNMYERVTTESEEKRQKFKAHELLVKLVEDGRLGQKTGSGWYKKEGKQILSLDFDTLEYTPTKKSRFDTIRVGKGIKNLKKRLEAITFLDDKGAKFLWECNAPMLTYTAEMIPEIADNIIEIDNTMKWGFTRQIGIFESWDAIGVERSVDRMKAENRKVPTWVEEMLDSGRKSFYETKNGKMTYWCPLKKKALEYKPNKKTLNLNLYKNSKHTLKRDWSASIHDIGDGVLNVEFHSIFVPQMNPIDRSMVEIMSHAMDLLDTGKYKGLVVGHQGDNWSAGANVNDFKIAIDSGNLHLMEIGTKQMQDLTQRIRHSKHPVVACPFNFALGGGLEFYACSNHSVASGELYAGLVEAGVGLVPGAGGHLRIILNLLENNDAKNVNMLIARKAVEVINPLSVSRSATDAVKKGFLRKSDTISMNSDHLLAIGKQKVLEMSDNGYKPPKYRDDLTMPGMPLRTMVQVNTKMMRAQGKISEHDEFIALKTANIISGGEKGGFMSKVDEQYILDIEREAFMSLAGETKTQERINHFLKTGKPLRN
jgi:3-hydroxyacyl-CoA dehydrogenase